MESKVPGVILPRNLIQILSSLGITEKPTKWNLCSTEGEFSLTLIWKQDEGKEQGWSGSKTTKGLNFSTTLNGCDSLELGKPKDVFSKPNFAESTRKLAQNATKTDFSGVTKISQLQNKSTGLPSSTFQNEELSLRYKEKTRQKLEASRLQHETKRRKELQQKEDTKVKVDVDHLPQLSNSFLDNSSLDNSSLDNKAKCSCGEEFSFKERAIKHILFSCPISLCFRIDLDLRINRAIDRWRDEEQRILGRKWWHVYKTSGFPDVRMSFPENALNELETLVNEYLAKAEKVKLTDKDKKQFVLMRGLENLPYELEGMIG